MDKLTENLRSTLNVGVIFHGCFDALIVRKPDKQSSRDGVLEVVRLMKNQLSREEQAVIDSDDLLVRYFREDVSTDKLATEIRKVTGVESKVPQSLSDFLYETERSEQPIAIGAWHAFWCYIEGYFGRYIRRRCQSGEATADLKLYIDFLIEHCKQDARLSINHEIEQSVDHKFDDRALWTCPVAKQWLLAEGDDEMDIDRSMLRLDISRALYWGALYEHFLMLHYVDEPKQSENGMRAPSRLLTFLPRVSVNTGLLENTTELFFQFLRSGRTWSRFCDELAPDDVDPRSLERKISRLRKNERALHGWELAALLGRNEDAPDGFLVAFINHFANLQNRAIDIGFSQEKVEIEFARYPIYLETVCSRFLGFQSEKHIRLD